ncbi:MAG: hypothetical protein JSR37_00680 [Verrucomicrobia bacterium]|nr:hypothetical protein [Verrucomicrobiota bacterium]
MSMFAPLFLLVLMPAGFIGSAWVTNSVFDHFRKDADEITAVDRFGTFILLMGLFGSYCYFICHLLSIE